MKIILIAGKAQNGKSTFANILKDKFEQQNKSVLIIHLADLLKYLCEKYFEWDGKKDEKGRSILQKIGTDTIREIDPDYWVDFIINFLSMFRDKWDYVLIADCRFKNELNNWDEDWDVTSVHINRLNFKSPLTLDQQNHQSEVDLDDFYFDYVLESQSGLDELQIEVDKFIEWMEGLGDQE